MDTNQIEAFEKLVEVVFEIGRELDNFKAEYDTHGHVELVKEGASYKPITKLVYDFFCVKCKIKIIHDKPAFIECPKCKSIKNIKDKGSNLTIGGGVGERKYVPNTKAIFDPVCKVCGDPLTTSELICARCTL